MRIRKFWNKFGTCTIINIWLGNQKLLPIFAPGNFKPLLLKAMLRFKYGII
jgi:hypothetical protein